MKLIEVMFLWADRLQRAYDTSRPRVIVVQHVSDEASKYSYLPNSMGRCCGGWRSTTPLARATHALCLFHQMVTVDGIPVDEVRQAFMRIDEYREYIENPDGHEDAEEENPFKQAYWLFCANSEGTKTL